MMPVLYHRLPSNLHDHILFSLHLPEFNGLIVSVQAHLAAMVNSPHDPSSTVLLRNFSFFRECCVLVIHFTVLVSHIDDEISYRSGGPDLEGLFLVISS